MLILEVLLAAATMVAALAKPGWERPIWQRIRPAVVTMASRRSLVVALCGIAPIAIRLALLPVMPIPEPSIHDEFSYWLAADTFAHGRLVNPTHPMWVHFETFHVSFQPGYMSMYPPMQGLWMGLGQWLFGHPWYGVLMSAGAFCAAATWMLQGWFPPRWAAVGGFIAVLRWGIFSYWTNGYWGGHVAATGGALLLGAYPRLRNRPTVAGATWLCIGIALLANSRSFEGLMVCIPVAVALAVRVWRSARTRRLLVPITGMLTVLVLAMAYYNARVYGSPFILPYQANKAMYAVAPVFVWQSPKPEPVYRHKVMRDFYVDWELNRSYYDSVTSVGALPFAVGQRVFRYWLFFLGPILTVPFVLGWRYWLIGRRLRLLVAAVAFNWTASLMITFAIAHYWAASTAATLALIVQGIRALRVIGRRRAPRLASMAAGVLIAVGVLAVARPMPFGGTWLASGLEAWFSDVRMFEGRQALTDRLEANGGKHLVLVRYGPAHNPLKEWVFNRADIDASSVVWAREMGEGRDQELLDYYPDRTAWLVEPDVTPPLLQRYPSR